MEGQSSNADSSHEGMTKDISESKQESVMFRRSTHPIERDSAILPTYAMECFIAELLGWLDSRLTGAIVWGFQRVGKTHAIRYILMHGENVLGSPIPMCLLNSWQSDLRGVTEPRFYTEILRSLGYSNPNSGGAGVKKQRAVDLIKERVLAEKEFRFLMFIDEAQELKQKHMRFLMDLHNELKIHDIRLVTILVGQPELCEMKVDLRKEKKNHLLGRFMTATYQYAGLQTAKEFKRLCYSLDAQSEYPSGSGITYTAYFVPKAFKAGWRLNNQSSNIWKILNNVCREEQIPSLKELPMQAIMAILVWLLQELADHDHKDLELERAVIEEAIYRVGIIQLEDFAHQNGSL